MSSSFYKWTNEFRKRFTFTSIPISNTGMEGQSHEISQHSDLAFATNIFLPECALFVKSSEGECTESLYCTWNNLIMPKQLWKNQSTPYVKSKWAARNTPAVQDFDWGKNIQSDISRSDTAVMSLWDGHHNSQSQMSKVW